MAVFGITVLAEDTFLIFLVGKLPVHTPDRIVMKDIGHWRDYVHAPALKNIPDELWDMARGMYAAIDGSLSYKTAFCVPGIFERCQHLGDIRNASAYYMEYGDELHDLIWYLTEFELEIAQGTCSKLHPDALFHHDDWGSEKNSFLSPSIFEDFFLEAYKQIYCYYHEHGVESVFHHSDSCCADLIPTMIEMGIDVWQGCMHANNVPELVQKYGDRIAFFGISRETDTDPAERQGLCPFYILMNADFTLFIHMNCTMDNPA